MNLCPIGDEAQDDPLRLGRIRRPEDSDAVGLEGRRGPRDLPLVRQASNWRLMDSSRSGCISVLTGRSSPGLSPFMLALANTLPQI